MASIRNSISLHDRMTPVFRSIIRSMDSTLRVMKNLDQQANKGVQSRAYRTAEKNIKQANNQLIKMQNNLKMAEKGANKLSDATGGVSKSMSSISNSGFNLINLSAALYLFKEIRDVLSSIMAAPDMARATQARLGLFNESAYTNRELYNQVYQTALATRTGLEETGNLATRILISGAMTGEGSAVGAVKTTGIINKALIAGGGTADENRRALLQLSQGLASGMLQGDELRAIREQTPYLTKILAEGLGKIDPKFAGTTIGDLKHLGAQGELTSERILKAFMAMEEEIDEAFKKMPRTFGQAMTQITSVWQYFLYLLSEGDGALGRINKRIWDFADYLSSDAGINMLEKMALVITVIADVALWAVDMIIKGLGWLNEHINVVYGAFVAVGIVAAASAAISAAAWLAAAWPVLLVVAIITGLIYLFLEMGGTVQEVVGSIIGGILAIGYVAWDVFIFIIYLISSVAIAAWDVVVWVVSAVILAIQGIVQILLWGALAAASFWMTIWNVMVTVVMGANIAVKEALFTIYSGFANMGKGVLSILAKIAEAIDLVFGSSIATAVNSWIGGLDGAVEKVRKKLDTEGDMQKIGDQWTNSYGTLSQMWKGEGKYDDWNILDNMQSVVDTAKGMTFNPITTTSGLGNLLKDPTQGWGSGYKFGADIVDKLDNFSFSFDEAKNLLDSWDPSSVNMRGGMLDSVGEIGKIKNAVELSDEDLQLLRDVAARDFLLNLQSITPVAKITFGDVRETADVNKIIEVIEDMVEEQLATSLVTP